MSELISVIIPVYNAAKYLDRCLESVLNNTYRNLEVICINDGSTDDSLQHLNEIAKSDDRVQIVSQENQGVSCARNAGLKRATGEYISFVDSDDWVHPRCFETLLKYSWECDIVMCKAKYVTEYEDNYAVLSDIQTKVIGQNESLMDSTVRSYIWGRLYKKEVVENLEFAESTRFAEDTMFNASVLCECPTVRVCVLDCQLYFYYQRVDSAVHTVHHRQYISCGLHYLSLATQYETLGVFKALVLLGCRMVLASRYSAMFDDDAKEYAKYCNNVLRQCISKMRKTSSFTLKEVVMYSLFVHIPLLYRVYRLATDRTLIAWERRGRQARKERIGKSNESTKG